MKIGFDNQKYLSMQSEHIRERINQFDNKLYLEFGGKLFDDYHASRVLPGFAPDSKLQMLMQLSDQAEIVVVISAGDIAGDHNCFYALFLQKSDDLSGVPDNGFFGFASIRNAGGISEVYDFFHGQVSHDFSGYREPADTGIKYTYRCVTICFHVSSPIQVSCFYSYIFLLSLLTYLSYSTCFVRRIQV